jgi:ABC-2 type transport system ATP-binding protein
MNHTGTGPVVSFDNVSKRYGSLRAVDGLSLELRADETVALLGPNGAGKSTSLDMLLSLRKPIRMFGSDPYHAVKSGYVGAMLQSGGLMPEVTVRELVTLVAGLHPRPAPVAVTLRRAGIEDVAGRRVDKLSGGQTQRVRFALAIAGECDLIVLDEPTSAMDVETRQRFWASMREEVAEGKTLLFATHYLEEAGQAADRILVINRGRLLADGSPEDIKKRAGDKRMSFRLPGADEAMLLRLPAVVSLETRHDLVQIQTSDSDATLYGLLDAGYRPSEIEVGSLGLRAGVPRHHRGRRPGEMNEMRGILLLTQADINRLRRNRRYLLFTVGLPVILYLIVGKTASSAYGVGFAAYYMVAMATLGGFAGALNGNAIRISEERKVGWIRQLRLTPLPASCFTWSGQ